MSETSKQPFKLHLPGLLRVLAEHLYANKQVAVRELIQNAHDSCVRRAIQAGGGGYTPRVELSVDAEQRRLTINDNGSGLTEQEIDDYLATIGRSYTRELKQDLATLSPDEASGLIGQFGFGFLSAFLLASEVTLITRSWQPGARAVRWRSSGDESYEVSPGEREEIGTTIELQLKASASFALRPHLLSEAVREFADFLPIPIYLQGDSAPLNLMAPPWDAADPDTAVRSWIDRVFQVRDPLCVIPLRDHTVDLGHDRIHIPMRGLLVIPPGSVASVREYGDMRVYIRRMFISRDQKDLLPPWARFVRGAIDCPDLQPTASREDVHQDETFAAVQQAVEEQLSAGLRRVAHEQPGTWRRIVEGHTDVLMGWAVRDDSFFENVADLLTLRTSRGPMPLPDYLQLSGGTCYYVTRELGSLQEQVLAEGHGVPVIDASWFAVTPFLHKYASRHPGVRLAQLDGEIESLMRPVADPLFDPILDFFDRRGVRARIAAYAPQQAPALMGYPEDAGRIHDAQGAVAGGDLPGPLADLIESYVEERSRGRDDLRGTLFLNASNRLIRRLAESTDHASRDAALILLYQVARLFAGRTLTASEATDAFGVATASLEDLLP